MSSLRPSSPKKRPRLKLRRRTKPLSWTTLHLGQMLNNGTYGIIYEYLQPTMGETNTHILSQRVDPTKVIKGTIADVTNDCNICPGDFINEAKKFKLIQTVVNRCQEQKPTFSLNVPVFGEGPFIVDRKCYYTMERMYPASLGILVGEGENIIDITAKLGQLYFQKTDESHSKNTVYDGYEYGMTSIQRICGAMSIDIAEVVDDMALFCSLCFQYSVLPLDVEYTVGKSFDGKAKLFIHDFDKVRTDSRIKEEQILQVLLTQLSYPDQGDLGSTVSRSQFQKYNTDNKVHKSTRFLNNPSQPSRYVTYSASNF